MTFRCKVGCSECCTCFLMPEKFVHRFIKRSQVPIVELVSGIDTIKPVTGDGKCFMLNRSTGKCIVYKDRPHICHLFGRSPTLLCPYVDLNGVPRAPHEYKVIHAHQELNMVN